MEMDHVVPLSRRGRHSIGNVVLACPACNNSKGRRYLVEWRYQILVERALAQEDLANAGR
jgi:5-methylcytosine-specific restriction endonuclease McrA